MLQNKLKNPIHVEEDVTNNVYRIFSSIDAYNLWAENPSDNADLQLFTIPRPSDYKLDLTISNNGDRYVKSGDTSSPLTRIQFFWRIYNDEGNASDGLTVTYTISNADGSSRSFTRRYNNGVSEDFSIADYLKVGENQVTIEGRGNNTGARNSTSFNITVLDIRVESGFNFAGNHAQGEVLRTPYTFYRNNVDGTAKIYFIVDDGQNGNTFSVDILSGGMTRVEDTGMMISPALEAGQHTLQIYAEAIYNDGQVTIYSNLLYFTFVVASTEAGVTDKFINVATSFNSGNYPFSSLTLTTTQYYNTQMRWGYYTYAANTDTKISVVWKLLQGADDEDPITLSTINASTAYEAAQLDYIPTVYTDDKQLYLAAYFKGSELTRIPIYITQNDDIKNVYETANYELKMTAYGRTNDSTDKDTWTDTTNTVSTTFTNIDWNPNSGWYNNSFRTIGTTQYATIAFEPFVRKDPQDNAFPFTYGKTIEIEFESEKVTNADDKLIIIGNPSGARVEITPNTASLYDNSNNEVVHTNYKANERIKLAFIINKVSSGQSATVDDGLAYIVNNGILERGAIANGRSFVTSGNIKIGGSTSGVRVYNLRVYDKSITYSDAYNNFVYDSTNKVDIVNRNKILNQGVISYDLCKNKLDTILITGNLSELLRQGPNKTDANVMIERTCPYDQSKDFILGDLIDDPERPNEKKVVNGARIRKHGQSTLNYPITSMKFWTNKSKSGEIPIYSKTGQESLLLNKNRYKMKNSSIPANKFVLQANYADSSGVHNGGLLRLIQESWYNAKIDGLYRLRTLPQLFTSIKSNEKESYGLNSVWADYFPRNSFPYNIEVAPDSFPCAVFYYDLEGTKTSTFLGQYVFMEDKKSDYCYGERSIYKVATDPFCLTVTHKDDDTKSNCIWDNKDVLRIEVLNVNDRYSSYETTDGFETFSGGKYGWEDSFEMIYPDPDDVTEDDAKANTPKSDPNSKFAKKAKPFVDWYKWLVGTRNNQAKFEAEAADHLDLYKLAAYYIFVLRFSLVDSLERNAQIKTYDGVHFHYEPWDMDIALGNKNDGGIAFNPPVDRNTKLNVTTYAISGRAADGNGNVTRSNWLWDALEAWPEWINGIVPKVADALYEAGLNYGNIVQMFDDNYANAWCEIMYNQSGHFKYVESAGGDLQRWLGWLQGARMSHRHWWLSTSMDYYDAKWFCGDYKNHAVYLGANITADPNKHITIVPNNSTFMTVTVNNQDSGQEEADTTRTVSPQEPLVYDMTKGASTKAPIHIYGANFMERIDMRDIAEGIMIVNYNYDGMRVKGVIGKPEIARSNRSNQLFFVNRRFVKDKILTAAAEQAYKGKIEAGKYGFIVLNIDMDPAKVDVNVHPAKLEVRFEEESKVFQAIYHAIKDALEKINEDTITKVDNIIIQSSSSTPKIQELEDEDRKPKALGFFGWKKNKDFGKNSNIIEDLYNEKKGNDTPYVSHLEDNKEFKEDDGLVNTSDALKELQQIQNNLKHEKEEIENIKKDEKEEQMPNIFNTKEEKNLPDGSTYTYVGENKDKIEDLLRQLHPETYKPKAEVAEEKDNYSVNENIIQENNNEQQNYNEFENQNDNTQETMVEPKIEEEDIKQEEKNVDESVNQVENITIAENQQIQEENKEISQISDKFNSIRENLRKLDNTQAVPVISADFLNKENTENVIKENKPEVETIVNKNDENEIPKAFQNNATEDKSDFSAMYEKMFGTSVIKEEKPKIVDERFNAVDILKDNVSVFEEIPKYQRPTYKFIGIIFEDYVVVEIEKEMYIINLSTAKEKIIFESLKKNYYNQVEKDSQMLLLPDLVEFSDKEMEILKENNYILEKAGFTYEDFGDNTVKLTGVPSICMNLNTKQLFKEIIGAINTVARTSTQEKEEKFMATIAEKVMMCSEEKDTLETINNLLGELLELDKPFEYGYDRPIAIKMTQYDIERKFSRK